VNITYVDQNKDNKVTGGDRFIISGCALSSSYEVQLFYKDMGSSGTGKFNTA